MNNGDDIHNLMKTLGPDAGLYKDLAQYNASRAALRRAAMVRPAEPMAAVPPSTPTPAPPTTPAPAALSTPVAVPPAAAPLGESPSLSAILHRLANPNEGPAAHGGDPDAANSHPASLESPPRQPTRLDRLFGRLSTRLPGALNR